MCKIVLSTNARVRRYRGKIPDWYEQKIPERVGLIRGPEFSSSIGPYAVDSLRGALLCIMFANMLDKGPDVASGVGFLKILFN